MTPDELEAHRAAYKIAAQRAAEEHRQFHTSNLSPLRGAIYGIGLLVLVVGVIARFVYRARRELDESVLGALGAEATWLVFVLLGFAVLTAMLCWWVVRREQRR